MNRNKIFPSGFSNLTTKAEYFKKTEGNKWIEWQCLNCGYYGELNLDWGLCCTERSRYFLETIFEHFGCENHTSMKNQYLNPNTEELVGMLAVCEEILSKIRPTYPRRSDKIFHLHLRDFLSKYKEAQKENT